MKKLQRSATTGEVHHITKSQRAREVYNNAMNFESNLDNSNNYPIVILTFTEWSDGFEPAAAAKGNRGSVWIKTVTISILRGAKHSLVNTYAIAIGKTNVSHEEVERKFAKELESFRSGPIRTFYHGGRKEDVIVRIELFASLMDQPKRRSNNFLMLGGSTYGARWGYSSDYGSVAEKIPACANCLQQLLNNTYKPTITNVQ